MDPKAATDVPQAGGRSLARRWLASPVANLALRLERSARLSRRLGDEASRRRRRKAGPVAPGLACGLYQRSSFYSLRALSLLEMPHDTPALPATVPEGDDLFGSRYGAVPQALLERAASGPERVALLEQCLRADTFVDFAKREPAEAATLAKELGELAGALIRELEGKRISVERSAAKRSVQVLIGAVLVASLIAFALFAPDFWAARRDLAIGKPWVASSTWGGGCDSPRQECPGDGNYFMHTQPENEPWLEFDLRSAQTISGAQVVNRLDCCPERAVPLVLEISTDHSRWREVTRSIQPFREWKPRFAPVAARWVRFRIPKQGTLHLKRVRILP